MLQVATKVRGVVRRLPAFNLFEQYSIGLPVGCDPQNAHKLVISTRFGKFVKFDFFAYVFNTFKRRHDCNVKLAF